MWMVVFVSIEETHVMPHEDLIEHIPSNDCICGPILNYFVEGMYVAMHSSLDGREFNEPDLDD
jgi:hypothetical protein